MTAEAWVTVERLRGEGWLVILKAMPDSDEFLVGSDWTRDPKIQARYVCEVTRLAWANDHDEHPTGQRAFWAYSNNPAEAITIAALKVEKAK